MVVRSFGEKYFENKLSNGFSILAIEFVLIRKASKAFSLRF